MNRLEMFFWKFVQFRQDFRYKVLLEGNNVQYGDKYYLVISRQIMLDKADKTILTQLGKNARLSSQEFSGGEVISSVPVMSKVGL